MQNKQFILNTGNIKALNGSDMKVSGWASTKDVDLAGDVVDPLGLSEKAKNQYMSKGRYWFNHDPNKIIGRVLQLSVDESGIFIDEAQLADTKFNKEYLWPLLEQGAIDEHSIQFISRKPKKLDTGGYLHQDYSLLEISVVSLACNPGAVITNLKSLMPAEDYYKHIATDDDNYVDMFSKLSELYDSGDLQLPSEKSKTFLIDATNINKEVMSTTTTVMPEALAPMTPDFSDFTVFAKADVTISQTGTTLPMPKRVEADYDKICEKTYIGKSTAKNAYMFRVADPTDDGGVSYNWDLVRLAMGDVLGAKGAYLISDSSKISVIKELTNIYAKLGKNTPIHDGVAITKLSDAALASLKFADVEFVEGEKELVTTELFLRNSKAIKDAAHYLKNHASQETLDTIKKDAYAYFSLDFSVYPHSSDDFEFIAGIVELYKEYKKIEAEEELNEITAIGFSNFIRTKEESTTKAADIPVDEQPTTEQEAEKEVDENGAEEVEDGVEQKELSIEFLQEFYKTFASIVETLKK